MRNDPTQSLEELAREAAAGDRAAFDRLARAIYPKLFRWALVKTRSEDDADEVVQRTLVRIHRGLSTFRGDSRVTTWAYRIAANTWLDLERARRRRGQHEEPLMKTVEATTPSEAAGPDDVLERRELVALVRCFFSTLAPRQREVIELVDFQGLEPSEAAEVLDVSPSTARVHLHRARRALRTAILRKHPHLHQEYGP